MSSSDPHSSSNINQQTGVQPTSDYSSGSIPPLASSSQYQSSTNQMYSAPHYQYGTNPAYSNPVSTSQQANTRPYEYSNHYQQPQAQQTTGGGLAGTATSTTMNQQYAVPSYSNTQYPYQHHPENDYQQQQQQPQQPGQIQYQQTTQQPYGGAYSSYYSQPGYQQQAQQQPQGTGTYGGSSYRGYQTATGYPIYGAPSVYPQPGLQQQPSGAGSVAGSVSAPLPLTATQSIPGGSSTSSSKARATSNSSSTKASTTVNNYPAVSPSIGQIQPPGIRPKITTTMWEDEKTLCYQVEANNVSVVRRADNNMINGTKLLNVAKMTRGRRDGILKSEKTRHVVKIGSMHLKGVWIPFERALAMAQREEIVDMLYPLFVKDIKKVIQQGTPTNQVGQMTLSSKSAAGSASSATGTKASKLSNAASIPTASTSSSIPATVPSTQQQQQQPNYYYSSSADTAGGSQQPQGQPASNSYYYSGYYGQPQGGAVSGGQQPYQSNYRYGTSSSVPSGSNGHLAGGSSSGAGQDQK